MHQKLLNALGSIVCGNDHGILSAFSIKLWILKLRFTCNTYYINYNVTLLYVSLNPSVTCMFMHTQVPHFPESSLLEQNKAIAQKWFVYGYMSIEILCCIFIPLPSNCVPYFSDVFPGHCPVTKSCSRLV
jgi:hypothetical protein